MDNKLDKHIQINQAIEIHFNITAAQLQSTYERCEEWLEYLDFSSLHLKVAIGILANNGINDSDGTILECGVLAITKICNGLVSQKQQALLNEIDVSCNKNLPVFLRCLKKNISSLEDKKQIYLLSGLVGRRNLRVLVALLDEVHGQSLLENAIMIESGS